MPLSVKLSVLQETGASLGFVRDVHTQPAGWDCPHHGTPLVKESLETISGWMGAIVCPSQDTTCVYSATGAVEPTEPVPAEPVNSETGEH